MPVVLVAYYVGLTVLQKISIVGGVISTVGFLYTNYDKYSSLDDEDDDFYSVLNTAETAKKEAVEVEANDAITEINNFVSTDAPQVEAIQEVATTNPTTMPEYLSQQNELLTMQIQATKNLTAQSKFQNDLLARSIQTQIVANANSKMVAETLASSLPALVMQMQQVSKIPATMKIKSEIETAERQTDREFQAMYSGDLITAISELRFSLATTQQNVANETSAVAIHTSSLATQTSKVADNAVVQQVLAEYQTSVAQIKDLDGNVIAELKPHELSTYKDFALVRAKEKEREIGDYQTTVGEIKNLDGTVIASIKPMEMATVKNAVNARNETDEMEFEIPDSIIDDFLSPLPLPSFTNNDFFSNTQTIKNGVTQ